jgi:hypothetical protein
VFDTRKLTAFFIACMKRRRLLGLEEQMANKSDPPRTISDVSHELRCTVTWLRACAKRKQVEAERTPHGHFVFRNKGIQQARELLYGTAAIQSKKNGR